MIEERPQTRSPKNNGQRTKNQELRTKKRVMVWARTRSETFLSFSASARAKGRASSIWSVRRARVRCAVLVPPQT